MFYIASYLFANGSVLITQTHLVQTFSANFWT
jgi:hypothetical protein